MVSYPPDASASSNAVPRQQAASEPPATTGTWFLLVNPSSGNGKGQRLRARVEARMAKAGILAGSAASQGPGHLQQLAAEAIARGHIRLAMLGGDGTANEVLNGVMGQQLVPSRDVALGMISVGTGNDWTKTTGMRRHPEAAVEDLASGREVLHDVGRIAYGEAYAQSRYFINIAGAGFDGDVTYRAASWSGWGKGSKWSYWISILSGLFRYRHSQVALEVDGKLYRHKTLTLAIGIGRFNGGGMMQLPQAAYDDGLLDATLIGEMSKSAMVRNLPRMLDGSFVQLDAVHQWRGKQFTLQSDPPVWLEVDGELLGHTPARIECLARAVRVVVPEP
jgi:YegS/Rv2252/BmrU family lipid kinase